MAYAKIDWNETTPRSVANLDHMETQYDEAVDYADDTRKDSAKELRVEVVTGGLGAETPHAGRLVVYNGYYYGGTGSLWLPITAPLSPYHRGSEAVTMDGVLLVGDDPTYPVTNYSFSKLTNTLRVTFDLEDGHAPDVAQFAFTTDAKIDVTPFNRVGGLFIEETTVARMRMQIVNDKSDDYNTAVAEGAEINSAAGLQFIPSLDVSGHTGYYYVRIAWTTRGFTGGSRNVEAHCHILMAN